MAEIDPLVAEILLKGDDEFLNKLKKIGSEGAENIEKLAQQAEHGASSLNILGGAITALELAISATVAATVAFIEQQTELTQTTILLADAFGTTAGQLQGIEAVFASAGVKVEQFERFANRLTITIAREYPAIAESIRTFADQNEAAGLRVQNALLRIRDAQNRMADNAQESASRAAKDQDALEAAYLKVQNAAQHAALEQLAAYQAVQGASLGVIAAQQRLATLQGRPPSDAEKKNLEIAQAQQAVDNARRAEAEARLAQEEKAASAALKRRQIEQEYADLQVRASKNARDAAEQRQKDENAVKEAVLARGEAEEKAAKLALTNVASIRDALDGIVKGNKDAANAIDLSQVSVKHLTDAIIAQAAETAKGAKPTGYELLIQLSRTLTSDTGKLISQDERLALVNRLAGSQMASLGKSAAEMLHVLELGPDKIKQFSDAAEDVVTKEAQNKIEEFRGALASFNLQISLLSQRFAAAIAPAFTAFLELLGESLKDKNGILHLFVDGVVALGNVLKSIGTAFETYVIEPIAKAFNTEPVAIWKGIATTILVLIAAFASPLLAIPILIAAIVTAVGYIADNWDKVKQKASDAWTAVKDSSVVKFFDAVIEKIKAAYGWLANIFDKAKTLPNNPDSKNSTNNQGNISQSALDAGNSGQLVEGHAEGGYIRGPGTGTSDSIMARLSNGEFVNNAKSVAHYGADLFHALNNMTFPGFAAGGLVAAPVRLAGGGPIQAASVLNLSIDGRSFNGLRGPKSTIDDLSHFAIARQTSAAGNSPSWRK